MTRKVLLFPIRLVVVLVGLAGLAVTICGTTVCFLARAAYPGDK